MAAKNITIPITDHDDNCTTYYLVEYKLSSDSAYTSFQWFNDQIVIGNVLDASEYDVRITRYCCNGATSAPLILLNIDTTTDSPQLAAPAAYTLTPNANPGELDAAWTDAVNATEYISQVAKDASFTVELQTATINDPTVTNLWTGLDTGATYYGRVKARASGYADSDWSNTDTGIPV